MKKTLKLLTILCIGCLSAGFASAADVLKAEISIRESSLGDALYKERGVFFVDTIITNTSAVNQDIVIWTQQGWSWLSDTKGISPGIEALKNAPFTHTLKPGESFKGAVEIFVGEKLSRPVTFRLGFFPKTQLPVSGMKTPPPKEQFFWSNEVTLTQ